MTDLPAPLAAALEGRYTLERALGEGGMATVYLARDEKHDRHVAIKVLKPELAAMLGAERFLAEIRTTANLQHPHILGLHDSGQVGGLLYFVMPYVDGESLAERLRHEKQLPVGEAVAIAAKVAGALQAAHDAGVVHRDVKPANILMQKGEPLVADFGIALAVQHAGGGRLTETGLSIGTPFYMSPEQASADRDVDARSDVYSLACVLYEMLAGEPPFTGGSAQAVLARILTTDPHPVTRVRASVPANVEAALARALERLPADRFASAADFAAALSDPAFRHRAERATAGETGRTRRTDALPWSLVAVLAALLGWSLFGDAAQDEAPVRRYAMELPEGQRLVAAADYGNRVALSRDGRWMAYVGQGPLGSRVWVRPRDRLEARPLEGSDGVREIFMSPDGSRIGLAGGEGPGLLILPTEGGAPDRVDVARRMSLTGSTWSDDGYIYVKLANFGGTEGLARVPETGGELETVTAVDTAAGETGHPWPHALPNGRGVLFTIERADDPSAVAVLEEPGSYRELVEGMSPVYVDPGVLAYATEDGRLMAAPFDLETLELTGPPRAIDQGLARGERAGFELTSGPNGSLAYVKGEPGPARNRLAWVDRSGREDGIPLSWEGPLWSVSLSPDGSRAALSTRESILLIDFRSGLSTPLTFEEGPTYGNPDWSADGRTILYAKDVGLYERAATGLGSETHLLGGVGTGRLAFNGSWSPDRSWLVWNPGGGLTGRPAGDSVRAFTLPGGGRGRISPDGRWLALDGEGVQVRPFPDVEAGVWQIAADADTPIWSKDGSELYWWDLELGAVVAAEVVQDDEIFRTGTRDTLFTMPPPPKYIGGSRGFDVTLDGRFLVVRPGHPPAQSLVFIENLPALVRGEGGGSP